MSFQRWLRIIDPLTSGIAVVLMLTVGALAAGLPARLASRVDPVIALRGE